MNAPDDVLLPTLLELKIKQQKNNNTKIFNTYEAKIFPYLCRSSSSNELPSTYLLPSAEYYTMLYYY